MKSIISNISKLAVASAIVSLTSLASPALADGFHFGGGGEVGAGFSAGSNASTSGGSWATGNINTQTSWSQTETGAMADVGFSASTSEGLSGGVSAEVYGIAANGNSVTTNGASSGSSSASAVSGNFSVGGGFHVGAGGSPD